MNEYETEELNAIDGEEKSARNFSEGNMGMGGLLTRHQSQPFDLMWKNF